MLGKTVCEETGWRKKQDKGQQDKAIDDGSEYHLLLAIIGFKNGILDDNLVPQIDKGVQEHDHQVGNKAFYAVAH